MLLGISSISDRLFSNNGKNTDIAANSCTCEHLNDHDIREVSILTWHKYLEDIRLLKFGYGLHSLVAFEGNLNKSVLGDIVSHLYKEGSLMLVFIYCVRS